MTESFGAPAYLHPQDIIANDLIKFLQSSMCYYIGPIVKRMRLTQHTQSQTVPLAHVYGHRKFDTNRSPKFILFEITPYKNLLTKSKYNQPFVYFGFQKSRIVRLKAAPEARTTAKPTSKCACASSGNYSETERRSRTPRLRL